MIRLCALLSLLITAGHATSLSGRMCMTVELYRTADNSSQFYECAPLAQEEVIEYNLTDKYLGVWNLRDCPENFDFDVARQKCLERKTMRRQQAACAQNPASTGCQAPCSGAVSSPIIGSPCDWKETGLHPDPKSNAYFVQCSPQSSGASCGEWTRMPCAPNTIFSKSSSICVSMSVQSAACGAQQEAVCNCARTAGATQCPGTSTCNKNVCCQQKEVLDNFIQHQAPLCPGSHVPPLASCNEPCPQYSACVPGLGCCPVPVNQPKQAIQITLCPGSFSPPLGSCGSCPSGTSCNPAINACCPSSNKPSTDLVFNIVQLCPNGSPAVQPCSRGCPPGNGCYQGACCPMTCPVGQTPLGFCSSGMCSGGGSCYQPGGCCCQEVVKLPVCANGQQSQRRCSVDAECGPRMECSNGGCCPMPFCPTGVQAQLRCNNNNMMCAMGHVCLEGLCCPLPRCPNGIISLGVCTRSLDCGRVGVECANGACCPLPTCPNNHVSTQRCSIGCANCCPVGHSCMNGGCCPLPQCPSGGLALTLCGPRACPVGSECVNGGCCPLPRCPSGLQATQRCQMGIGCARGHQCENGVCCAMPMCSTGIIAASVCGMGNSCPMGFVCEGRGCCQEPPPLCPNGGRASQRCNRGAECPPGFGCTPLGGCCLLSMEPVCPARTNAICQCSPNSACPSGATCTMGTCCAKAVALFNQIPGSQCQASTQCNGYSTSCAQCTQGICACVNGAASNGASCLQMSSRILTLARNGCDQYGSPCTVLLSTARRKPIIAPVGNITETPLFFNVANERKCVANATDVNFDPDSTCLPNEKCINGECRMKLWPGEYGCSTDEECTSRCPNTYCEKKKSDKNVAQCQCRDGQLLFGRCFSQCPQGFHESGAYCMHDDEDAFWSDGDAQDRIKALLNSSPC
ncbi:hypothetical protein Y032_0121g998 [Ancylostoma ceylanicum]|uniref:Chitin-binding type-2 domain-containing protein n=1 Tax=Ancylostoma ceylanicum TaxID=53326 RepID=A0A016TAF6_9BILA|nr:hypothetical protein Y032_0121g998 [Ancylostoma ceylanicum]